ncbi:MAG: 2Fe-2S iron-sulfur cluster-binding protein, partial [Sulfurimonas sp.]
MSEAEAVRTLKINILRFDPNDPDDFPHMQTFEIQESAGMTLYIVLNEIREHHDNALMFDFVCRAGICGSCSMLINGRPGLACRTLTSKMDANITLAPLPLFELIKDLSIHTGKW